MRRTRLVIFVGVVVALIVGGGIVAQRWRHNHPPYAAAVLHATAHLRLTTTAQAQAAMSPVNVATASPKDQLVVGTVSWRKPPTTEGYFSVYVIDKRSHLKPSYMETNSDQVAAGGNSWDDAVSKKFPWLAGAGLVYRDGSWMDAACDLELDNASGITSVTFVAVFPGRDPGAGNAALFATAPVQLSDLIVGLVFIGADDQLYWADRLL